MDPAMMKQAMEMMKNMPQDQLQKMMGSVTPEMMQQAQAMASRMSPDDMRRAQEQMSKMSPEQISQQAAQASQHFKSQQQYILSASQQLKQEGNALHIAGKYQEALDKYERAKANVEGYAGAEAAELRKACALNLSSCYLNLQRWADCVAQCEEVLAVEGENLKALYRRGQAHLGAGRWAEAVEDLGRAAKLSGHDPAQQKLIREKLQDAKDQLSMQRAAAARTGGNSSSSAAEAAASAAPAPASTSSKASADAAPATKPTATTTTSSSASLSKEGTQQLAGAAVAAAASGTSGAGAGVGGPSMTPEMLEAAAKMMRETPDWAQQVERMMEGMSDEQLAEMSKAMGGGTDLKVTREQLAAGRANLGKMDPAQLEKMAAMQRAIPADVAEKLRANPADPEGLAAATRMMKENPDMVKGMADMLAQMSPDQLSAMAKQAGMPPGMSFSPEMAKAAAESFAKMSPEEVERMASMAASMKGMGAPASTPAPTTSTSAAAAASSGRSASAAAPAAAGTASAAPVASTSGSGSAGLAAVAAGAGAGPGGMPAITPEMAKMAADMMANMPPETLQAMSGMMGGAASGAAGAGGMPAFTPEMAKMAADMMSKMSPEDLERMSSMMGGGAGPSGMMGGAGGPGGPSPMDMMGKMNMMDPAMMETAMKMMRGMDTASLTSMLMQSGMVKSQEQAEQMAKQMQGMSDTQMKMMMKAAGAVQKGAQVVAKTKEFVTGRMGLVVAIAIILLAVLLRWLGIM